MLALPIVAGTAVVYPIIKETMPQVVSAEFLSENKVSIFTTSAAIAGGALAYGIYSGITFAAAATAVASAAPIRGLGLTGVAAGYLIYEYVMPSAEKYYPESVKNNALFVSTARVMAPVAAAAIAPTIIAYKTCVMSYYVAYQINVKLVTPLVFPEESLNSNAATAFNFVAPLGLMAGGYGLLQIPVVGAAVAKVGTIYQYTSRGMTAVSVTYQVVTYVDSGYIQSNSALTPIIGVPAVIAVMCGTTYIPGVSLVLGKINGFVNIDEVILMSILNIINERALKTVELPDDPMLRTVVSDGSSTAKTAIAWQMGLKKGSTPYTGTKTIAAAVKPAIKLLPVAMNNQGLISNSTLPYARVGATYVADLPATWISNAEQKMYKARKDNPGARLGDSLFKKEVVISSLTTGCFKTVAASTAAKGTKVWQNVVVMPALAKLNQELKQYCSGTVSDFCTYITIHALPTCVRKHLAYRINNDLPISLSTNMEKAVNESVRDVKFFKDTGEDSFCKFLEDSAVSNKESLDADKLLNIRAQDTSDQFWGKISSKDQQSIQATYNQFTSVTEFAQGTKMSVSLWDYLLRSLPYNYEYLPSLSLQEIGLLSKAESITLNREIANTYIFAVSVRFITVAVDQGYLPLVERHIANPRGKVLAQFAPVVVGGAYLGWDINNQFTKIGEKKAAKAKITEKNMVLEQARKLLHIEWQQLFKSHSTGLFNKDKVASQSSEEVVDSMRLCDQFKGVISNLDPKKPHHPTVKKIVEEVRSGCEHVKEAYNALTHTPKTAFEKTLNKLTPLFKQYCNLFDKNNVDHSELRDIRDACKIISRSKEEMSNDIKCVCDNVNKAIDEIISAGEGISSEIAGQFFEAI